MKNDLLTVVLAVALIFVLSGCGAGACTVCSSAENTSAYQNLSTGEKAAICAECLGDSMGSPDLCAWCQDEPSSGFYINLLEIPVFVCQDCYAGLS